MNTYADPHTDTYLTRSMFIMPTKTGGKLAIAVTTKQASYLIAAYALFVTGIIAFAWDIAVFFILMFYPTEMWPRNRKFKDGVTPLPSDEKPYTKEELLEIRKKKANRYIALISVVNSDGPRAAIPLLLEHAWAMWFRAGDLLTGSYDIFFVWIAVLVLVGSNAAGTLIPSYLELESVSPPKSGSIFYSIGSSTDPSLSVAQKIKIQQMRAPATQRAMGTVESARVELLKNVHISDKTTMPWKGPNNETIEQVTYDYKVTGLDFGLQLADSIDFVLTVQGACTLEYGWYNQSESTTDGAADIYTVFGNDVYVLYGEYNRPPGGNIQLDVTQNNTVSNKSYAIIPDIVDRSSTAEGTDPWYETKLLDLTGSTVYSVIPQRPVLSCWENDVWSYKGQTADSVLDLGSLPGLDLSAPIRNEIIPSRLTYPMINEIAAQLGNSILVSSTGTSQGVFDASISSYYNDLERLLLASYVATQNIFLDTTLISEDGRYGLHNDAFGDTGTTPQSGVNKFIIRGSTITTLSPEFLILIPLLWFFLWVLRATFSWTRSAHRNSGKLSRLTLRAVALQPVQMYRILDEEMCGFRDDWTNRRGHLPFITEAHDVYVNPNAAAAIYADPVVDLTKVSTIHAEEVPNEDGGDFGPRPGHGQEIPNNDGGDFGPRSGYPASGTNGRVVDTEKRAMQQRPPYPVYDSSADGITGVENGDAQQRGAPPASNVPAREYKLFIAPKVAKTEDGNFNLKFTGPIPHEEHHKVYNHEKNNVDRTTIWSWRQDHGDRRKVVADEPDHVDFEPSWFRQYILGLKKIAKGVLG